MMTNTTSATHRSLIGIPLGDIAGVGPEIVAMALAQPAIYETARPLVIGEIGALRRALLKNHENHP
jgi:4-hydroxythreonine-4-phosphate dehydrogenase